MADDMPVMLAALLNLPTMPSVTVRVVPYSEMRYATSGDWQVGHDGALVVTVADLGDERFNLLVAAHEVTEALLARRAGVTEQQVDEWDLAHLDAEEPGEVAGCPYFTQHARASEVERLLAELMGVDWDAYSASFESLGEEG
jgi:hypothetical protein